MVSVEPNAKCRQPIDEDIVHTFLGALAAPI